MEKSSDLKSPGAGPKMPPSTREEYLKGALRGIAEGAGVGCAVILFRVARAWLSGEMRNEAPPHPGEIAVVVAIIVGSTAFVFGVGRAISGGWIGSSTGAVVLGLLGLGFVVFCVPQVGRPLGRLFMGLGDGIATAAALFSIFAVFAALGAVLGATAERAIRLKHGVNKAHDKPGGEESV